MSHLTAGEHRSPRVTVVGHPFAPIGRGEDARSLARALGSQCIPYEVMDIYGMPTGDGGLRQEFGPHLVERGTGDVCVFVINGDEVEATLERVGERLPTSSLRVVWPAWELSLYPEPWARHLDGFDEVWVNTTFIQNALATATRRRVLVMAPGNGIVLPYVVGRRHFGIPESAFVFLFAFDFRSYIERKNPAAVLDAFMSLVRKSPFCDVALVVKCAGGEAQPRMRAEFLARVDEARGACGAGRSIQLVEGELVDAEVKNLVRNCDCFVSLHRSEGFGRLLAEAMLLGKPVIATGYSGNLDFMNQSNSCLVAHRLVPVAEEAYPYWQGQVWAEPDVGHATWWMGRLASDWRLCLNLGQTARMEIRTRFSFRAAGVRYWTRLREA
jgi:glycosyltransferase involved in cell wall biosynthesis